MRATGSIRVLVVDDSAVVRDVLSRELSTRADIEVVGTAADPYVARDKIVALKPDVITLDLEMPRMDGITFLGKLMHFRPMPVVVVSSVTTAGSKAALDALAAGAFEVVAKPGSGYSVEEMADRLAETLHAAVHSRKPLRERVGPVAGGEVAALNTTTDRIVAIGASTGGTVAIERVLAAMPPDCPPIAVVQHMPVQFTRSFAERLDSVCAITVKEAQGGEVLTQGTALVAPGDRHLLVRRSGGLYRTELKAGPPVCRHRPSVDVLFRSLASSAGVNAIGVLLTGMGTDGAVGLGELRRAGGLTLAQDEETSVVWGMPREAIDAGAATRVLALSAIPAEVVRACRRSHAETGRDDERCGVI